MRRKQRKGGGKQLQGTIDSIGGRGDGVLTPPPGADGPIFVPLTVPGDEVRVQTTSKSASGTQSEIIELLHEGPDRVDPPCPHYGACGGCQLQHWSLEAQRNWKLTRIEEAVSRAGFDPALVLPLESVEAGSRRRAEFIALQPAGKPVQIGFRRRSSHWVEVIESCMVLAPELVEALPLLRDGLDGLITDRDGLRVHLTLADNGLDIALSGSMTEGFETQDRLAGLARSAGWARLTHNDFPIAAQGEPFVELGGAKVALPQRAFLQPSRDGQAILQSLVLAAIPDDAKRVMDLYSGHGTFALPLAERGHTVEAYESSAAAITALKAAANAAGHDHARRHPRFSHVAALWCRVEKGTSRGHRPPARRCQSPDRGLGPRRPPTIVAVSCNPATFARDARTLREGGYSLEWVAPLDQFLFTGHVELVARFYR